MSRAGENDAFRSFGEPVVEKCSFLMRLKNIYSDGHLLNSNYLYHLCWYISHIGRNSNSFPEEFFCVCHLSS